MKTGDNPLHPTNLINRVQTINFCLNTIDKILLI